MTDVNSNESNFSEYNYFLEYSSDVSGHQVAGLEVASFTVGAVHYDYPGSDIANTTEVYWGLDFDLPADPYLKAYHDLDEADGTYYVRLLSDDIQATKMYDTDSDYVFFGLSLATKF